MSILDNFLEKIGLKYDDLREDEREQYDEWYRALEKRAITVGSIRSYIVSMRESVEKELTKTDHNTKQDIFLKARLRNYVLLEGFLSTPERAKEALERSIAGMVGNKKRT